MTLDFTKQELHLLDHLSKIASSSHFNNTEQSLKNYCEITSELLQADNTTWLAAKHGIAPADVFYKTIFDGWWVCDIADFNPDRPENAAQIFFELSKEHGIGEDTEHVLKTAGKSRVVLRQDIFNDNQWDEFWKTKHFNIPILGVKERLHSVYTLSDDSESYFMIDRKVDKPPFSERDRNLSYLISIIASPLHRKLFIERGLLSPASSPLSGREREVFRFLFSDLTAKEIANELDIAPATAQQYINNIYQKFSSRGRMGLVTACLQDHE